MLTQNGKTISEFQDIHNALVSFYSNLPCCKLQNKSKIKISYIHAGLILQAEHWPLLDLTFAADEIKKLCGLLKKKSPLALMDITTNSTRKPGL